LIYSSGLRRSELINLEIKDIDTRRGVIIIRGGKGKKDRQSIISQDLILQLRAYYNEYKAKKWLFEGTKGKRYSPTSISKILSRAVKKSKIYKKVTPHTLRHSFATHLLEQGTSLRHIQTLLGHNSSKTTEIYTQVSSQEIEKIRNPLDDFFANNSVTIHPISDYSLKKSLSKVQTAKKDL
jgi:integrase/recombinase XerD